LLNINSFTGPPLTADRKGVVVVAVSANQMSTAGAAGGASGSVSVQVGGGFADHSVITTATIQSGAQINQANDAGANGAQSVYVDAGRSYQDLTLAIGVALAGTFGASPAFTVPVLQGNTSATIVGPSSGGTTNVSAQQDVDVSAVAQAKFIV